MTFIRRHEFLSGIKKLTFVTFLMSLAFAYVETIWAVYMDSFFHKVVLVGAFSAFLSLVAFMSYFLLIPLVEKSDKAKLMSLSMFLFMIAYLLFGLNINIYIFIKNIILID